MQFLAIFSFFGRVLSRNFKTFEYECPNHIRPIGSGHHASDKKLEKGDSIGHPSAARVSSSPRLEDATFQIVFFLTARYSSYGSFLIFFFA